MRKLATVLWLVGLSMGCGGESGDEQRADSAADDASEPADDAGSAPDASEPTDASEPGDALDAQSDDGGAGLDAAALDAESPQETGSDAGQDDGAIDAPDAPPSCVPDGKAELCDGVDNDCDPSTLDGVGEASFGQPCDGPDSDSCSEGAIQCMSGALACSDASADTGEVCDGADNDCDGSTDETCQKADFTVLDFALAGDGASVAVGTVSNQVRMMCFGPDGAIARSAFDVAGPEQNDHSILSVAVARARDAGNIAVAFTYRKSTNWYNYIAFFDRACQLVAARQVLDGDLPNTGLNRRLTLSMSDDGRTYALYEHDTQLKFRALVFDTAGVRTAAATLTRPTECAGDGRPAVLALNAQSGDFAVVCETNVERKFRRFSASGAALDSAMRSVPDSQPDGFSFHYWTAAMNRSGALLYFGRTSANGWILRAFGSDGVLACSAQLEGTTGVVAPRSEPTSSGAFLAQLPGADYQLALIDTSASVTRHWGTAPQTYRLDAQDNVYVVVDGGIVRSRDISLR